MIERSNAVRALAAAVRELGGKQVWNPAVGVGSFVTINFGGERTNSTGMTVGEYHLWVYGGIWSVVHGSVVLATSNDSRAAMERAVERLDGLSILEASVNAVGTSLKIRFSGDLTMRIEPTSDPVMEHWLLYLPDGFVISSGPGEALVRESASG